MATNFIEDTRDRFFGTGGEASFYAGAQSAGVTAANLLTAAVNAAAWWPAGTLAATLPKKEGLFANNAHLTSGRLSLAGITLAAGTTITNIVFYSGTQAAVTPTNWRVGIYSYHDSTPAKVAESADQLTRAIGASSPISTALTTPYVVPSTAKYYLALYVVAATAPSLMCQTSGFPSTELPFAAATSTTGLTNALPATAAAMTATAAQPVMRVT